MSIPPKTALRKAAKGAVMAGTFAVSALAVGALVKRRLYPASPVPNADATGGTANGTGGADGADSAAAPEAPPRRERP